LTFYGFLLVLQEFVKLLQVLSYAFRHERNL
jgi:hypothetical protein